MAKMKDKQEAAETKWESVDFLKAFYVNRGNVHKDWESFYGAMNDACMAVTGSILDENVLSMRCGAAKAYYRKAGGTEWTYPERPKKTPKKKDTIAEIMAKIEGGEIELEIEGK